jgi:hypothetical protein
MTHKDPRHRPATSPRQSSRTSQEWRAFIVIAHAHHTTPGPATLANRNSLCVSATGQRETSKAISFISPLPQGVVRWGAMGHRMRLIEPLLIGLVDVYDPILLSPKDSGYQHHRLDRVDGIHVVS